MDALHISKDLALTNDAPAASLRERRYDVDWIRTLALSLLIIYHVTVCFQPWARKYYYIQNGQLLNDLWIAMGMINVWRIPVLFMIAGMGASFSLERRDWKQFLAERSLRILLPYVFSFFTLCPILAVFALHFYDLPMGYYPNSGHLWFLANMIIYIVLLLPFLIYLKKRPDNLILGFFAKLLGRPWGVFIFVPATMLEAWLVNPHYYGDYVLNMHGLWLGLIFFIAGYIYASLGEIFWSAVQSVRWQALVAAFMLYLVRQIAFGLFGMPNPLIAVESMCWVLAVFGFGSLYLNKPSLNLSYFSKAVYPVYIVHLPVQFGLASLLLPLDLHAVIKLILLTAGTFGVSLLIYEYILKRIRWIRPLFGMKLKTA